MKKQDADEDEKCKNPYLEKLMEIISGLNHVDGECISEAGNEYFYACVEIELPYHDGEQRVLVEISINVDDKTSLDATFRGKLFALSTDDPEVFIENVLSLFSKTIEIYELFGWLISVPPGLNMDNLSKKEVFLSISRTEDLGDVTQFGNTFSDAILDVDILMNYLVEMING